MKRAFFPFFFAAAMMITLAWTACDEDDATGPNDLGGETNLELTQVGQEFPISLYSPGSSSTLLDGLEDSTVIIANDKGIVTVRSIITFDTAFVRGLEQELGIASLSNDVRHAILESYVERFGAVLDTTDKTRMTARVDAKLKVTSEGIQEFVNSRGDLSKPFTLVKYNANVGDKYEFTDPDGVRITRTVTYKSTTDDYDIGFWRIKVIKVEETSDNPLADKITYYANHKFGLVGVDMDSKFGKKLHVTVWPPTL